MKPIQRAGLLYCDIFCAVSLEKSIAYSGSPALEPKRLAPRVATYPTFPINTCLKNQVIFCNLEFWFIAKKRVYFNPFL